MCREPPSATLDSGHPEPAAANPGLAAAGTHNGPGGLTEMSRPR